jgi:hypothetical protein
MGGLVFNTHRGMGVVKAKHAPCQPRTALQLRARSIAVNLARQWALCVNQAAWDAYAATHTYLDGMGLTIRASGINWYVGLNSRLNSLLLGSVETPPVVAAPGPVVNPIATPSAGEISLAWDGPSGADQRIEVYLDGPHSAGRKGSLPKARLNCRPEAAASPEVITGLTAGTYSIYLRTMSEDDGQVSTWNTLSTVVT